MDLAPCGVNASLASALELQNCTPFKKYRDTDLAEGLLGTLLSPLSPQGFAAYVKERLHCDGVKYTVGNREELKPLGFPVELVLVCCLTLQAVEWMHL